MKHVFKLKDFLKPYWVKSTLALVLLVIVVVLDLAIPRMVERIIDQGIAQSNMTVVVQTGLIMIGLAAIGMVGGMGMHSFSVLAAWASGPICAARSSPRSRRFSFGNLDKLDTGKLITRLTDVMSRGAGHGA